MTLSGPDCLVSYHPENDCNDNDIPDECEIADGTSEDCNVNGLLDECEIVIRGDNDDDGDVDLDDFSGFASCEAGPDVEPADPSCCTFDFDGDGDVDLIDWSLFQIAFTG
jgi:hypothetical protein